MHIYSIKSYKGRNIYSHRPVIKMVVDLDSLYNTPTREMGNFNEKLLAMFPGLEEHYCSLGERGGFAKRLKEGTYIGHVTEHLIIELQHLLGYDVRYGKTRVITEPSLYCIVYEYSNEKCGIECGKAGVSLISDIVENRETDLDALLKNLREISLQAELGPSTRAIYEEAKKRGIPVTRLGSDSILRLGCGKYSRLVEASLTDGPSCINIDIAGNKCLTKEILSNYGIPVPYGDVAYTEDSAVTLAEDIGFPVVLKPYNGNQGKGVTLNIVNGQQVRKAFKEAMKFSSPVIVEKFIRGKDYRILVVGDKVSAVSERRPPFIVGDGAHSVRQLVEIENNSMLRGEDHERPLTKIKVDSIAEDVLERQGMDENYIPKVNEAVRLRDNSNLSTGGTAVDCTGTIHPFNSSMAVNAAKATGLDVAGIDITAEDIAVPINHSNGAVIEVNAAPGLRMHLYPTEGECNNVAGDILDMLYPQGKPCSIPIVSVTGTNGKTTTTRLISHAMSLMGQTVGMTCTSGVYIDHQCIMKGDNTGPVSAGMVLSDKRVEAAVLETARGGIVKKGLGYDLADVGVIVNVSDDHIGIDGLNSMESLAFVKALVVEAVKPEGHSVLNADDAMTPYLLDRAKGNKILFSCKRDNRLVVPHIASGGKAVYMDGDSIIINDGRKCIPLMDVKEIPITFGGIVECNIENSLAAASALYALGIPADTIKEGLKSFKPDINTNPGRFNMFDMGTFNVMLDYSHNTAGYHAVVKFISKTNSDRLVGVIGMPGDRLDRNISQVGEICGKAFAKLYIKEDGDLRGRKPGEVGEILRKAVLKSGFRKENISVIHSELKALEAAILDAQPGDLIVMFYEEFEPAVELVTRLKTELEKTVLPEGIRLNEPIVR